MTDRRLPRVWVGFGVAAFLLAATAFPGRAQVSEDGSVFTGTASARLVGFDIRLSPTIGFDPLVDAGASVAEAQLNSRGESRSFAATPYPGTAVVTLPGTVSILTNGDIPADQVPEYPLYAAADHPTNPSEHLRVGVYDLSAASNTVDSRATATDGQTAGTARVTSDPGTKTVVAHAESSVAAIRIGDLLTLSGVRSVANVRQVAGGELEATASFEVAAISIAGQKVALTGDGLHLLGQSVALDGVLGQSLEPLLGVLADSGTTIEILPERDLDDGITSGGLRITTTQAPPPGLTSGIETVTIVYTLGASTATVSNRALPAFTGGTVPPASRPPSATGIAGGPVAAPVSGGSTPPVATSPSTAPDVTGGTPAASVDARFIASIPLDVSAFGFYPVLVIAGAVIFAASRLFPYLGGRSPS